MIELSKEDVAMINASAGDLDMAGVETLRAGVVARLEQLGVPITKNHVRAAITAELSAGK